MPGVIAVVLLQSTLAAAEDEGDEGGDVGLPYVPATRLQNLPLHLSIMLYIKQHISFHSLLHPKTSSCYSMQSFIPVSELEFCSVLSPLCNLSRARFLYCCFFLCFRFDCTLLTLPIFKLGVRVQSTQLTTG
jgi:hypothetical protein